MLKITGTHINMNTGSYTWVNSTHVQMLALLATWQSERERVCVCVCCVCVRILFGQFCPRASFFLVLWSIHFT
jgi:hypothetical protein